MQLLITENNFAEYIDIDEDFDYNTLKRFIKKGTIEFLLDQTFGIGQELYDHLVGLVDASEKETTLIDYLCTCLGDYTLSIFVRKHAVDISAGGVTVNKSEHVLPASDAKIDALAKEYESGAFTFLEKAFEFLEHNQDDFEVWKNSNAYTTKYDILVSSVIELRAMLPKLNTRIMYMKLRGYLNGAESSLFRTELGSMLDIIKVQKRDNSLTAENEKILLPLQRAITYKAYSVYCAVEGDIEKANQLLEGVEPSVIEVLDQIKNNPDLYPEYPHHPEFFDRKIGNDDENYPSQFVTF